MLSPSAVTAGDPCGFWSMTSSLPIFRRTTRRWRRSFPCRGCACPSRHGHGGFPNRPAGPRQAPRLRCVVRSRLILIVYHRFRLTSSSDIISALLSSMVYADGRMRIEKPVLCARAAISNVTPELGAAIVGCFTPMAATHNLMDRRHIDEFFVPRAECY